MILLSAKLRTFKPCAFPNCLVRYRHAIFIFRIFLREWDIIFEVWSSSSVTVVEFDDRFFNSEILKEFVVSRNKMTDNRRLFHYPSFCILRKGTLVHWNLGDWDFKPRLVWSKLAFLAVGRPWFARLGRFNVTPSSTISFETIFLSLLALWRYWWPRCLQWIFSFHPDGKYD